MSFKGNEPGGSCAAGMELIDGVLGLHVDDFLGGGEGLQEVKDSGWDHVPHDQPCFISRLRKLSEIIELGAFDLGESIFCTGIQLWQAKNHEHIKLTLEEYLHKAKPLAIDKKLRATPQAAVSAHDISLLRGLNGPMIWPVSQVMLAGAASLSIQAAQVEKATVQDLL